MKIEHGLHVLRARLRRLLAQARVLCVIGLCRFPLFDRPADRQITVDQIMRRGLVSDQIGLDAALLCAFDQLGQNLRRIAKQADGHRFAARTVVLDQGQRVVQILRLFIEITRAQTKINAALLTLNVQRHRARERRRQRLCATHTAQTCGQNPTPRPVAAKMLTPRLDKGLIRALHNALRANINPATGGHLAVHEQSLAIQFVKMFPIRPFRHKVRVRQQHARRIGMGFEHTRRFARLHQQRFILIQIFQRRQNRVIARPIARRTTDAAVHHQMLRILRDFGVQIILNHAVRRFGQPVFTIELCAARGADHARGVQTGIVCAHGVLLIFMGCYGVYPRW